MKTQHLITAIPELRAFVAAEKSSGRSIGVVPTMGALHEGHLSLVRTSLAQSGTTIVTIFVNPTQFAAGEDLKKYPKSLDADLEKLAKIGDVVIFAPAENEMYPHYFSTTIQPPQVARFLEGEKRPTHFAGVATVVLKLLNLTQADFAFFGQKDFQQQLVISRMVQDLNVSTEIIVCPIVREPDGLALSSRNIYLSPQERQTALTLNRMLTHVENEIRAGQRDSFELIAEMRQLLIDGGVTTVDYVAIADPLTLESIETIRVPVVALVAAYVGRTRLIDNRLIENL